ncbi:retention module-containing protein, partial [Vibrio sp. S11_S32]|uniref:retention module-containing protein n=1 Tax=Vibrio sp. S11_S32 TaxID=2720225 RepID=UPI00168199B9
MENSSPATNTTNINVENGEVFVIKPGQGAVLITGDYQLQPDEVLLVSPGANATVSGQGQVQHIHSNAHSTSIVAGDEGPVATPLDEQVRFNAENAANAQFSEQDITAIRESILNGDDPTQTIIGAEQQAAQENGAQPDDIAAIQQAILAGQDPTEVTEAPAAGVTAGGSANESFVTVAYDYDSMLAEAGHDTEGFTREYYDEAEQKHTVFAEGGQVLDVEVTEGDLDSGTGYPTENSQSAVVESGSNALDPSSFYIPDAELNQLLGEMNSEITSGGEPVNFVYDADTNTFIGTQDGEPVASFDVDFVALPNGDMTVTVTTTIDRPLDHIDGDTTGMVTTDGDDIHINFPISGDDVQGNPIVDPIIINIDVLDGNNEQFGFDTGTDINESDDANTVIHGQVPLDLGSDEMASIVFDPNQPALEDITSNGQPTDYTVDGNVATVTDINGEPVLTVEIQTDGSYTVEVTGPIDQDADDILQLDLGIIGTDDDGDTANGDIHINIADGTDAADVDTTIDINEGDLQPDNDNAGYPVSGSSSVTITALDDNLDPTTLRLSDDGKTQLSSELGEMTTNGGDPINFSMTTDANGVTTISGVDGAGNPVLDITMTPTFDPATGNVTVDTVVNQYQPLDDNNGTGENTGLITNIDDVISVELPFEIDDTDGDTSDVTVHVNFKDGEDPSFGVDTGASITENDGTQTANGSIEF